MGVPNKKNNIAHYSIQYDDTIEDEAKCDYTTQIPNIPQLKKLLKEAIARADDMNYRFARKRDERGFSTHQFC